MATPHASIKEPLILIARVTAKEGKGHDVQALLSSVRAHCESDQEPGCLTYRTSRGAGEESDQFTVYEEYTGRDALVEHRKSEPYQNLFKAQLVAKAEIVFQNEFK